MRTTLYIADDVLLAARDRARRENRSAGEVISELARRALTNLPRELTKHEADSVFGFRPFPKRGGIVSNETVDRLRGSD